MLELLESLSDSPTRTSLVAAVLALIVVSALLRGRGRKYPGGPSRLRSTLLTLFKPEKTLKFREIWRAQYGKIYTSYRGPTAEVYMTDYDVIHEAFVEKGDHCSSRPSGLGEFLTGLKEKGLSVSPHWKEQRKFALEVLREQGMGKVDMEYKILEEVSPFLKEIEKCCTKPVYLDGYMHRSISNVICNLVLGARFEYDDPVFISLLERFLNQFSNVQKMSVVNAVKILQWLPGDVFGYHKYLRDAKANSDFFRAAIRDHAEKLDPSNPKDFIDAYLVEIQKKAKTRNPTSFDEVNCLATVIQLFVAGTDTTANTLMWAWLFMIIHPDVQEKVYDEIEKVIGSRQPSLMDKARMSYTEAVLTEIMRLANTAIGTIPHKTDADVHIGGHLIPKDTFLFAHLAGVHLNEENYENPTHFNPARFLDDNGLFAKPKKFIPFGIGRRVCIGESLARAELFLYFTSVMQHFRLESPPGVTLKAEGSSRPVHKPLPYAMVFKRR